MPGITASISPHTLRHFLFTWLKIQGIADALALAQADDDGNEVLEGPAEPVQRRDDQDVAGPQIVQGLPEFFAVGGLAGLLAGEYPDVARGFRAVIRRSRNWSLVETRE